MILKFFFCEIEIWVEPGSFVCLFSKDNFLDSPFFDTKFVEINRKKIESDYQLFIFISPYLLNLYTRPFEEINNFFKDNSYYILDNNNNIKTNRPCYLTKNKTLFKKRKNNEEKEEMDFKEFDKNNNLESKRTNYFKWYFEEKGKKIPTSLNRLEKTENIISDQFLKDP